MNTAVTGIAIILYQSRIHISKSGINLRKFRLLGKTADSIKDISRSQQIKSIIIRRKEALYPAEDRPSVSMVIPQTNPVNSGRVTLQSPAPSAPLGGTRRFPSLHVLGDKTSLPNSTRTETTRSYHFVHCHYTWNHRRNIEFTAVPRK